ncbi:MAG: hypothetical protein H6657_26475 [Ardenticatenaceae bacterium]|nr:hypothetical protein [Ardenticatenaceae bacterium]
MSVAYRKLKRRVRPFHRNFNHQRIVWHGHGWRVAGRRRQRWLANAPIPDDYADPSSPVELQRNHHHGGELFTTHCATR